MESKADAERYHRYNEPDPEMDDGGYRTPHKPIYATLRNPGTDRLKIWLRDYVDELTSYAKFHKIRRHQG